jgi:predicted enzyme related to lactoylglutathione lyase
MAHGQITHIEFPADDTARAKRFYSELFGWKLTEWPEFPGYFLFSMGSLESAGGAIGERGKSVGDKLRIYIEVDAFDEVLPRVPGLGGKVVTARTAIPGQGFYAVLLDSEGSEVALYEGQASASSA